MDAFSFESGGQANCPVQPKPRKFFKSRATEDTSKNPQSVQNPSIIASSYVDFSLNHTDHLGSGLPSVAGSVGYLSPTYKTPANKIPLKRGRGRPKGSRNTSPRSTAVNTYTKAVGVTPGRGAPRGRRRSKGNRTIRGQQASGRGKRRRPEWEQSESEQEEEEEPLSSDDVDEQEEPASQAVEEEEDLEEKEGEENKNGDTEHYADEEDNKEELKPSEIAKPPPIKLRIIRQNDTNAFVSKVGTGSVHSNSESNLPIAEEIPQTSNKEVIIEPIKQEIISEKAVPEIIEEKTDPFSHCTEVKTKQTIFIACRCVMV